MHVYCCLYCILFLLFCSGLFSNANKVYYFITQKFSRHSVDVEGDKHNNITSSIGNFTKVKVELVELLSRLLQCSTHSLTHWTAWLATGRSVLQDLRSSAIIHVSSALSPVSSSICSFCRIHAPHGRSRRRLHSGLLSGPPPALYSTSNRKIM